VGEIGLRVAVNTGEVVVDAATDDVVGDPVNVAARLQDVAQDGDVVIGEATHRLVGDPFENLFSLVAVAEGDRVRNYEFFNVGDTDLAIARFEGLCSHLG